MEYEGKLYGKVDKHYFQLKNTTNDFDELLKQRNELLESLKNLYNSCNPIDVTSGKCGNVFYVGALGIPKEEDIHKSLEIINKYK